MTWSFNSIGYEDFYFIDYNIVEFVESKLMFRKKILPQSIRMNSKWSKKPLWKNRYERWYISPNVSWISTDYTKLYSRRQKFSKRRTVSNGGRFNKSFNDLDRKAGKKYYIKCSHGGKHIRNVIFWDMIRDKILAYCQYSKITCCLISMLENWASRFPDNLVTTYNATQVATDSTIYLIQILCMKYFLIFVETKFLPKIT
jgi:hypothetical protein